MGGAEFIPRHLKRAADGTKLLMRMFRELGKKEKKKDN